MEDEGMPQKKHKPEEIVAKLRQVDVLVSQGQSFAKRSRPSRTGAESALHLVGERAIHNLCSYIPGRGPRVG
jgi:hypothetical protein